MLLAAAVGNGHASKVLSKSGHVLNMQHLVQGTVNQELVNAVESEIISENCSALGASASPLVGLKLHEDEATSLSSLTRPCQVLDLDTMAECCGLKVLEGHQSLGYKWTTLSTPDGQEVTTAADDSFRSGRHLLAYTLARFMLRRGTPRFLIDLDMSQRRRQINESGVFKDMLEEPYSVYCQLMAGEFEELDLDYDPFSDPPEGYWDEDEQNRVILTQDDKTVDQEVDFAKLSDHINVPGKAAYRQFPKPIVARAWIKEDGDIRVTDEKYVPPERAIHDTKWIVVGYGLFSYIELPLAIGPECSQRVDTIEAALGYAESICQMQISGRVWGAAINQGKRWDSEAVDALKALPKHVRPSALDYALLAEATKRGQKGGLAYVRGVGIHDQSREIFGSCLDFGGLSKSTRKAISVINSADYPLITRYHLYVKVLSRVGKGQPAGRVPRDPAKAAIWQMVRSYCHAGLRPSAELDYDWCLDV